MLRMMEKYANDLEDIISDRTKQLTEEKKKTDILLYRMMPKLVILHKGTTLYMLYLYDGIVEKVAKSWQMISVDVK